MKSQTIDENKRAELKTQCSEYLKAVDHAFSLSEADKIKILEEWYNNMYGGIWITLLNIQHHYFDSSVFIFGVERFRQLFIFQEICEEVARENNLTFPDKIKEIERYTKDEVEKILDEMGKDREEVLKKVREDLKKIRR